jgi:hypothetical protein
MSFTKFLATTAVVAMGVLAAACGSQSPTENVGSTGSAAPASAPDDGITLSTVTPARITGVYRDGAGDTLAFDLARADDVLYVDLTGNEGRPILHIQTDGDDYNFSYMGGAVTMQTTKAFIAQASAQAQTQPQGVSTAGFTWTGNMDVLGDMMKLPEVAQLPILSRALGVRGLTGNDFPASLALHKVAQQSAMALSVPVQKLETPASEGYCEAYPNESNDCYGMCGPGCSCWSWVCGDCCYHYGCAVHDSWCRDGEWWLCDDITAVIALFGC